MKPPSLPPDISARQIEVASLCRRAHAKRLVLFGSAARGEFIPGQSDLDFVAEFDALPPGEYSEAFFALKSGLEEIFGVQVDLLTQQALRNPYLIERVRTEAIPVYGA